MNQQLMKMLNILRSIIALCFGVWLLIKGMDLIGNGVGVRTRYFLGLGAGLAIGIAAPFAKSFYIALSFLIFVITSNILEQENGIGALIDLGVGMFIAYAAIYLFNKREL
ncbi:MAG: hypothetical protein KKA63_00555 [Gammaproteobacteria bacterium]|nr:hypothetical protein [Gammaproteobacteria bacterium]